jgi:uncharacterized protein
MSSAESPFTQFVERYKSQNNPDRFEVGIPMRDGLELAADVYLPIGADSAPTIVEVTPYQKDSIFCREDAEHYQRNGYGFVSVDCRGRGKSEGEWTAFLNDPQDCHDVIEWVAAQPWSTGKVGMTGLSYMGWVQWAAASQRPPHLTCLVSNSAAGRWQQEIPYTNGAFQLFFAWWGYGTRRRISESGRGVDWEEVLKTLPYGDLGKLVNGSGGSWELFSRHDRLDEVWESIRYDDSYDQINVPCLHVTGWYDLEDLLGAFHHYEMMDAHSPAAADQYLLVGPWSHVGTRFPSREYGGVDYGPQAAIDMSAEHLRWFDHWLKGSGEGIKDVERVRVFEPGRNSWRGAKKWPLSNATDKLYLDLEHGDGALRSEPSAQEQTQSYRYDPLDPALTGIDVNAYPAQDPPLAQNTNEARSDVLSFTSAALTEEQVLSGWAQLVLYAASDCEDTEWHVKITDVDPEGVSRKVTQGCLRAACRDSLTDLKPLTPNAVSEFNIEFWPTQHVFQPGHRVRVTVTSSDYPWFARSLNQFGLVADQGEPKVATNTVSCGGEHPSYLALPVERSA